jgi:hypothetical protein
MHTIASTSSTLRPAALRVPATDLRFNVAYELAVGFEYFAGRVRSALANADSPAMAVVAVEQLERAWSAHATELRRRLTMRMRTDQRALFADLDGLIDDPSALSPAPTFARHFANLWLIAALSSRIGLAKLHGPEAFPAAILGAMTALRDYAERRWLAARDQFLEQYPWLEAAHVGVAVEGMHNDAETPVVVVTHIDTLP